MKQYVVSLFVKIEVVVDAADEKEAEVLAYNRVQTENDSELIEAFVVEA